MATAIPSSGSIGGAGAPYAWPSLESMEEGIRAARKAAVAARHAGEDFTAEAVLNIRKHPLRAVGVALAAGVVVGSVAGLCAGWCARR